MENILDDNRYLFDFEESSMTNMVVVIEEREEFEMDLVTLTAKINQDIINDLDGVSIEEETMYYDFMVKNNIRRCD